MSRNLVDPSESPGSIGGKVDPSEKVGDGEPMNEEGSASAAPEENDSAVTEGE
jgi:hypothetical protein